MTREEFHKLTDKRYNELQALNKLDNFYDYEKQFVGIWQELGKRTRGIIERKSGGVGNRKYSNYGGQQS